MLVVFFIGLIIKGGLCKSQLIPIFNINITKNMNYFIVLQGAAIAAIPEYRKACSNEVRQWKKHILCMIYIANWYNYCKMTNLAANSAKLITVSNLIRFLRFSKFSHKFVIFRYVTDFCRGLKDEDAEHNSPRVNAESAMRHLPMRIVQSDSC